MIPTVIVIPVRDRLDLTRGIVHQLQHQSGWDTLQVWDNGSDVVTKRFLRTIEDPRVEVIDAAGLGIYDMWRGGYTRARAEHPGALNVLFLNNDVRLQPRCVEQLAVALRSRFELVAVYPDYFKAPGECEPSEPPTIVTTAGSYRHGGLVGWCFMLAADRVTWDPLIDPQFEWWCGEDDLVFELERAGGQQGRVECVVVEHLSGQTASAHPWTQAAAGRDMERCLAKWGR